MGLPCIPEDSGASMQTERLVLEPMLRSDAAEMYPLLCDSRLYEFTGGEPPSSVSSLAEVYGLRESRRSPDGREVWLNWVVRRRESREAVGYTQATVHLSHTYVAWVIGSVWQGRGYAIESAGRLVRWLRSAGVHEVRACVNPAHAASGAVALRAGLHRTADMENGEEVWTSRPRPLERSDTFIVA